MRGLFGPLRRESNGMSIRLVYLDQNKWIQISRVIHGKDSSPELLAVVEFLKAAKETGRLEFPLSLAHYMENHRHPNGDARRRLAQSMASLSDLKTLANPTDVVRFELDRALARRFPDRVSPRPFTLVGSGVSHALGRPIGLCLQDAAGTLTEAQRYDLERQARWTFEFDVLAGPGAGAVEESFGIPRDSDEQFVRILSTLKADATAALSKSPNLPGYGNDEKIDLFLRYRCIADLRGAIDEVLVHHRMERFSPWGDAQDPEMALMWARLLDECPSRCVDIHLMRQFVRNENLKREASDLNDFAYLGIAAAYCDVVVCEKQVADLLNRPGLTKKAVILSDIRLLPTV